MTTRVTISFVNLPKPGKTNGSIKTKDDVLYGVKPDMLSQFEPKSTYDIEYTERAFNHQMYKTVTSAKKVEGAPPAAGNPNKYDSQDMVTAERIFVCGLMNSSVKAGAVDLNTAHLTNLVNIFRLVWDDTFGKDGKSGKNADMGGDEIPF